MASDWSVEVNGAHKEGASGPVPPYEVKRRKYKIKSKKNHGLSKK